jgi:hypothetical protein
MEWISMLRRAYLVLPSLLVLTPALAHTGIGETTGLAHGFVHPIGKMSDVRGTRVAQLTGGVVAGVGILAYTI